MNRYVLGLVSSLMMGCASQDDPSGPAAENDVAEFKYTPLGTATRDQVLDHYKQTLEMNVARAKAAHPTVTEVTAEQIPSFAAGQIILWNCLAWYLPAKAAKIAVDGMVDELVHASKVYVTRAVDHDGFVKIDKLSKNAPVPLGWVLSTEQISNALDAAKAPPGVDLADFLWLQDAPLLPVVVSTKPSPEQVASIFDLDPLVSGDAARAKVAERMELDAVLEAPGIKEVYFVETLYPGYGTNTALFLDEHNQIWGASENYQVDE